MINVNSRYEYLLTYANNIKNQTKAGFRGLLHIWPENESDLINSSQGTRGHDDDDDDDDDYDYGTAG